MVLCMDKKKPLGIRRNIFIIVCSGSLIFMAAGILLGLWSARKMREQVGRQFNEEQLVVAHHVSSLLERELSSIKNLVENVLNDFSDLYGLVNNAAIFYKTPLFEVTENDFDLFMNTNLKGPFFIAREFARHMIDNERGRIVNIADVSGEKIWPDYLPYCLSKSGIISLTKGLAKALAPHILVNGVSPGTVLLADQYDEDEENAFQV